MHRFLISNDQFREICADLKEKTYYNQGVAMLSIKDEVFNGLGDTSSVVDAEIAMPGNQMLDFMQEQYEPGQSLHQVLLLVGTPRQAYTTTCLQYMEETWPESGRLTVDILNSVMQAGSSYSSYSPSLVRRSCFTDLV